MLPGEPGGARHRCDFTRTALAPLRLVEGLSASGHGDSGGEQERAPALRDRGTNGSSSSGGGGEHERTSGGEQEQAPALLDSGTNGCSSSEGGQERGSMV